MSWTDYPIKPWPGKDKMAGFKILHKSNQARVGQLKTAHGIIETPNFIPVGTQGSVKALSPRDLKEIGVQVVLANTYHLMLRPGADLIGKLGGLHQFMGWDGPIMTDSGGFQVFSLGVALEHGDSKVLKADEDEGGIKQRPRLNAISEKGVTFQSHIDGTKHILTPEKSIEIQAKLGADLMVAFDDHESSRHTYEQMLKSLELTERWGLRSLKEYDKIEGANVIHLEGGNVAVPLLYGVVHGGIHKDLRIKSAKFTDKHFEAIAIGGIYGDKKTLSQIVESVVENISQDKPRHLLGIGEVEDLFNGIERGIDFFDCVAPTRRARNGSLYISPKTGGNSQNKFAISIGLSKFTQDENPIDLKCNCYTCQNFSRAYLRHLYMAGEILYHHLATYHNVYFITNLVSQIREAIRKGEFKSLKKQWVYAG